MAQTIVIYQDEGVREFGLRCLGEFFKGNDVWMANADAIIDGRILQMADLFVMPGGADLPYCKKLNGAGNQNIRAFVEDGGTYLGICAGAYYACRDIEYHKGHSDEICGSRELAFVDCTAAGSLADLTPPHDATLRTATIANLALKDGKTAQVFYQGGPAFYLSQNDDAEVIARYKDVAGTPPAIIRQQVGDGLVILSGVHFEITPALLPQHPAEGEQIRLAELCSAFKAPFPFDKVLAA